MIKINMMKPKAVACNNVLLSMRSYGWRVIDTVDLKDMDAICRWANHKRDVLMGEGLWIYSKE